MFASDSCIIEHDWFTAALTFGLCCGLIISYLPQHFRIIHAKTSEGLSPLFLLLGSTSAASSLFNILTMQSGLLKCCSVVSGATCLEISAGIVQLSIQWVMFSLIFVLYMRYYPQHLRAVNKDIQVQTLDTLVIVKSSEITQEWKWSIVLSWVAVLHFILCAFTTAFVVLTSNPEPGANTPLPPLAYSWARFLGVSAAILASIQYTPQLIHTYRSKLVGALSIPMMCIQTPGGVLMVLSIALRPGTNWTSWLTFAIAAVMQGMLLTMCILWKLRQKKLGIDDFGVPNQPAGIEDGTPTVIVTQPSDSPVVSSSTEPISEQTPLLGPR
ncbi:hypothetical protein FA15DRAFT_646220 [Coprinopsis marcescibilis]|uniref:PQ loop repeat protein n=1 Tax=Coprinopsis marcescibilis TaxID=230819 RepID=A0A5C3KL89_COPMA|nr:hypothetical protein FA15DRAFT_646220 [Coprinopsis marcescibilis]